VTTVDTQTLATAGPETAARSGHGQAASAFDVGGAEALERSGRMVVRVPFADEPVLVVRSGRRLFAFSNRCPHANRSLSDARVRRRSLECAGHGKRFDLSSGRAPGCPTPVRRWDAWTTEGRVWIAARDAT
jgi:nitrite reductase/ring-hydroxylating ferredoxin subunit